MNPKTGSHTISKVFESIPATYKVGNHANYPIAQFAHELENFDTYKFYCFYRDPVERFNSAFKFYKRVGYSHCLGEFFSAEDKNMSMQQIKKEKLKRSLNLKIRNDDEYFWISQEFRDKIESVTPTQLLNHFTYEMVNGNPSPEDFFVTNYFRRMPSLFMNQKFWLDYNVDITLLNFADFENQIKFLASEFGVTLDTVPYVNENIPIENEHILTAEEIQVIKQFYQPDYDFFASKGITF